jgi:hypothetical protein
MTIANALSNVYTPTYINGCILTYVTSVTITVSSGSAVDSLGVVLMTSAGYTLDFTALGANGIDAGTIASNKIYAIFLIVKPDNTTATLASLSPTAPTLPTGYTRFRRIGWQVTKGGSALMQIVQTGQYNVKKYFCQEAGGAPNRVLSAGSATTSTSIDCSAYVPPGCFEVGLQISLNATLVSSNVQLRNSDYAGVPYVIYSPSSTAGFVVVFPLMTLSNTLTINYLCNNSGMQAYIDIMVFTDYV